MSYLDTRDLLNELDDLRARRDAFLTEPVEQLDEDSAATVENVATCGACGRMWNDGQSTAYTPVPSGRCPFEAEHLDEDDTERLTALETLFDEIGEDGEARYGATMIPVSEFADYAQELAEETIEGFASQSTGWPFNHIDWDAAADDLAQDYTEVSFDGDDYFVRL